MNNISGFNERFFPLLVFLLRALAGLAGGFLIMRFFYPGAAMPWSVALAVMLVGLAYVFEYFRNKNAGPGESP